VDAVFAELPLAFLAFAGARRLLKATVLASILAGGRALAVPGPRAPAGAPIPVDADCSLRTTPLAGCGLDETLPARLRRRVPDSADVTARDRPSS
jgi:hypothetical protein